MHLSEAIHRGTNTSQYYVRRTGKGVVAKPRTFPSWILGLVILATSIAAATSFLLPSSVRIDAAAIALAALAILYIYNWREAAKSPVTVAMIAFIISWSVALSAAGSIKLYQASQQLVFPLSVFMGASAYRSVPRSTVIASAMALIIGGIAACYIAPSQMLSGTLRRGIFFGGFDVHSSAYLIMLAVAALLISWPKSSMSRVIFCLSIAAGLFVISQLQVRTIMVGFFVGLITYASSLLTVRTRVILIAVATCCLVAIFYVALTDPATADAISSGRLSNYLERIHWVSQRGIDKLLFGSGPGTDRLRTTVWWWDEKDSHNDFLSALIERGILGAVALTYMFIGVGRRMGGVALAVIVAFAAASIVSNALPNRPIPALLAGAVLALARQRDSRRGEEQSPQMAGPL